MIKLNNISNVVNNIPANHQGNTKINEKASDAVAKNESSTVVNLQSNLNRLSEKISEKSCFTQVSSFELFFFIPVVADKVAYGKPKEIVPEYESTCGGSVVVSVRL